MSNYPDCLLESRQEIEGNFIFCIYQDLELLDDYIDELNPQEDFLLEESHLYLGVAIKLYDKGIKTATDVDIRTFLSDKETLLKKYESMGGFSTINQLKSILNKDNIDAYWEDLKKWNLILEYYDNGNFNVEKSISKLKTMSDSEQVSDFFEYQAVSVSLNKSATCKMAYLDLDDNFIQACEDGEELGLSISKKCPILNSYTMGIHRKESTLFAGYSGTGKTSFLVDNYLVPRLDEGDKITIAVNEQGIKAWQHFFLASILYSKFDYYKLPRQSVKKGNFMNIHGEQIKMAQQYFRDHYQKKILFAEVDGYDINEVKKAFRYGAKRGHIIGIYDTFKAADSSDTNYTGRLIEDSKQLHQIARKQDMAVIITMQLALHTDGTRYLTSGCLSNAKGVKEVMSEIVLMRNVWEDEFSGEKYDIKPYRHSRVNGKYTSDHESIKLDQNKKYKLLFLDKTRNSEGEIALIYQFDGAWNKWTELGFATVKHDRSR